MVDVPAFNVMLVDVPMSQGVPVDTAFVTVNALAPRFSVRVLVLLDENDAHDAA